MDAAVGYGIEFFELRQRDRALQFAHAVVEGREIVVGLGVAVSPGFVDEQEAAASERVVVGDDQAAFAGGHVLALLRAKAADGTEGADVLAVRFGVEGLGAVFDDREVVLAGQFHDRGHFAGVAEQVRDHDGFGFGADGSFDRLRSDVERDGLDFGEDRDRALVEHRRERAHVGNGRRNNFVAWVGVEGSNGDVNGGGARGAGVGVLHAEFCCELLFQALGECSFGAGERAGGDDFF